METTGPVRRPTAERTRDALARLATERDIWVSTAHPDHGPHQVPLWFLWDGRAVWMCTSATSATARNVRTEPRVRLALQDTYDVVLLQGEAECFPAQDVPRDAADAFTDKFGWDPRTEEGIFLYLRVPPKTVRAWRGEPELRERVIMRNGTWQE
ncbi:pyridoxamine 5'-phosphate oxidase family protein [Streptomyces pilosus]|uniref:pyridoxamine 5'-phosphate oxidase family protein n=1 Tax=Streptomyces pilosus TaxID=28893 RepID=UPI0036C55ECE